MAQWHIQTYSQECGAQVNCQPAAAWPSRVRALRDNKEATHVDWLDPACVELDRASKTMNEIKETEVGDGRERVGDKKSSSSRFLWSRLI